REVDGDLGGVQALLALVGQRYPDRIDARDFACVPPEQTIARLGDGTDQLQVIRFEHATQDRPAHAAGGTEDRDLQQLAKLPSARRTSSHRRTTTVPADYAAIHRVEATHRTRAIGLFDRPTSSPAFPPVPGRTNRQRR